MEINVSVSKKEYQVLLYKAEVYDEIVETEELTIEELERLEKAKMGKSLTEKEFLKLHPELE